MEKQNIYDWKRFLLSTDRVGRLGYFYLKALNFCVIMALSMLVSWVVGYTMHATGERGGILIILASVLFLVMLFLYLFNYFFIARRRLHDRNSSGWYALLLFVPIVGFILLFMLHFFRGSESSNSYGEPSCRMSTSIHVVGLISFILGTSLTGMMALIFLALHDLGT